MSSPTRPRTESNRAEPATTGKFAQLSLGAHRWLEARPSFDYFILRTAIFLLTGIGVVMVMSSSMTWSVIEGSTVWGQSLRQAMMVLVGLVAFWVALRIHPNVIRRISPWLLGLSVVLLIAVLIPGIGTGREEVGSQSWIALGPLSLQPSELAKVTVAIWGASYLADKPKTNSIRTSPFTWYILVAGLMTLLITLQGDFGMAITFAIVVVFALFFAGIDLRFIIGAFVIAAAGLIVVFLSGGFRSNRFYVYFDALFGNFEDTRGAAFQSYQGFLSLADGAATGVGLGQSRAKWFYLPEAKNDFIFAVIGEELGLWGGALVISLFALLGYFGIRTALRAQNRFQSLMAATLTASVVSQAFINIGYVVGLLPVTGIQLPMISAGGTSAVITLGSMGLLVSIARHEPEAVSATQSYGRPLFDRIFFLPEPSPARVRGAGGGRGPRRPEPSKQQPSPSRFGPPVTRSARSTARGPQRGAGSAAPPESSVPVEPSRPPVRPYRPRNNRRR